MTSQDELFMQRCLDIALWAEGKTSPNPMVGAVLVYNNRIIGEGFHQKAGAPHAEVNCFASVKAEDEVFLPHSTLYVSLEPCSHFGKTPPCVDLVLEKGVRRVVVAMKDPFPQVAGRGIQKLRNNGVEVVCGVLEEQAEYLNRFFLTAVRKKRPYVTLKWAESEDGYIDSLRTSPEEPPFVLSTPLRQREVHRLRAIHDAILVGRNTVVWDNPKLTNRYWSGKSPIRIVLDKQLSLLKMGTYHLFVPNDVPTWIVVAPDADTSLLPSYLRAIRWDSERGELSELLEKLKRQGIQSLLVEGGAYTLQAFIDQNLYDAIDREVAPLLLKEGVKAPLL